MSGSIINTSVSDNNIGTCVVVRGGAWRCLMVRGGALHCVALRCVACACGVLGCECIKVIINIIAESGNVAPDGSLPLLAANLVDESTSVRAQNMILFKRYVDWRQEEGREVR